MTRIVAVVPGRMGSTRFPGKMLAAESGTPLIVHSAHNAAAASLVEEVYIASDSVEIETAAVAHGIEHRMTRADHPNGTSRIAELVDSLEADIIVNVQGDEPDLEPAVIDTTIAALQADPDALVSTAATPIFDEGDLQNPAVVKVATTIQGRALYFSRGPIPHDRDGTAAAMPLRHVGLYVYRPEALQRYVQLPPTPLEQTECLEQLRLLEHGLPVTVARVGTRHVGIDTPEQYAQWLAGREG